MSSLSCPGQNRLLAALPERPLAQLREQFEVVFLTEGEALCRAGRRAQYVFFPTTALISWQYLLENGNSAELAVMGSDGLVGIGSLLGGSADAGSAMVIKSGQAWRILDRLLRGAFERDVAVRDLMLRYAQALIAQIGQSVVCNRHHALDQQVFRSLLDSLDRSQSGEIVMTHELLARRLGVRREGVSEVAHNAQEQGLIAYRRGRITILDRAALESRTCECYRTIQREYARLLLPPGDASRCARQDCPSCATQGNPAIGTRTRDDSSVIEVG